LRVPTGKRFHGPRAHDSAHIHSYGPDLEIKTKNFQGKGVIIMSGKTDIVKGRVEEAAGALTDNAKLRNKGKTDQAVGRVKQAAEKIVDKVAKKMRD
jgi:uncharacterized protein YjbJ (UPF0337 family)